MDVARGVAVLHFQSVKWAPHSALSSKNLPHRVHRVSFLDTLIRPIALDASKPQCKASRVAGTCLQIAERDLDDDRGPQIDRPLVAMRFMQWKFFRLPLEYRVGQS